MPRLERSVLSVNGVRTSVLTAGSGEPVVCLHGAGTAAGHDWVLPFADDRRVILPIHPGFGDSEDDVSVESVHDLVLHYLELFDLLGLERFSLVGQSLGAQIAATFALEHAHRLVRLVLAAPSGLDVAGVPRLDLSAIPPDELPSRLTADDALRSRLAPRERDVDLMVDRYRESTSLARFAWSGLTDRRLRRWAHRIAVPTLLLWGSADTLVPVSCAEEWSGILPDARLVVLLDHGHLLFDESREAHDRALRFLDADAELASAASAVPEG